MYGLYVVRFYKSMTKWTIYGFKIEAANCTQKIRKPSLELANEFGRAFAFEMGM